MYNYQKLDIHMVINFDSLKILIKWISPFRCLNGET
jgi:hypothetical protein